MSSISLNDKTYMSVIVSALKQLVGRTFPNPPVASIVVESNNNFTTNKIVHTVLQVFQADLMQSSMQSKVLSL